MSKIILTTQDELKQIITEALADLLAKQVNKPPSTPEILNIDQAAQVLDLSVSAVYTKVNKRLIPHFKRGKRLYFRLAEITEWIQNGKRISTEEALKSK